MYKKLYIYIIYIMVIGLPSKLYAQHYITFDDGWSASVFISSSNFHGDLSDKTNSFMNNTPFSKFFYQDRKFGGGLYIDKMFGQVMGVRGILLYTQMKSTKESSKMYFQGDLYEYSLAAYTDFSNLFLGYNRRRLWSVYGYLGIGYSETRSTAYDMNTGDIVGSTGYKVAKSGRGFVRMTEVVVPVGLGVTYSFSKKSSVYVELSRHFVHTNKLDAFPVEGTQIESVGFITLGISYTFGLPTHWHAQRTPRYDGKSPDAAIRSFNKRKRVIMKTKANRKALKRRKRYGRKRFKRHRW